MVVSRLHKSCVFFSYLDVSRKQFIGFWSQFNVRIHNILPHCCHLFHQVALQYQLMKQSINVDTRPFTTTPVYWMVKVSCGRKIFVRVNNATAGKHKKENNIEEKIVTFSYFRRLTAIKYINNVRRCKILAPRNGRRVSTTFLYETDQSFAIFSDVVIFVRTLKDKIICYKGMRHNNTSV